MEEKRGKLLEILNSKIVIGIFIFFMLFLATVFAGNVIVKEGSLNVSERIYDKTGYVTSVGEITMFGGSSAPSGWLVCDGTNYSRTGTYADLYFILGTTYGNNSANDFNVPDMRGIFPRGAGTSGKLTDANSNAFTGILGTYQNDKFQGHRHDMPENYIDDGAGTSSFIAGALYGSRGETGVPETDGSHGTPRTGTETNPANLGVTFIIKY